MRRAEIAPGRLTVPATETVNVTYDSPLNLVEIIEGNRLIRSEVAPRGYTLAAFMVTVDRVRAFYSNN